MGPQDRRSNHLGVVLDGWVGGHEDERLGDKVERY